MSIKSNPHMVAIEVFAAFQKAFKPLSLGLEELFKGGDVHLRD